MLLNSLLLFISNFLLVFYGIKKIIYISHQKHLFDEPSETRKIHISKTPNLGGVSIFASVFITLCILTSAQPLQHINFVIAASIILFGLGLTDDLVGMNSMKKFATEIMIVLMITLLADIRMDHVFHTYFGFHELPYWLSISVSAFFILFIMNAINLIDGINGLAGGIGLLASIFFTTAFWNLHDFFFFQISISLTGCLCAFLLYNITPAKIFMGDTGSLFLGFILSILSIHLMESRLVIFHMLIDFSFSSPTIILALLMIPIIDTTRVFFLRLVLKKSPFDADRKHIHHLLLDTGYSHMQVTGMLLTLNVSIVLLSISMGELNIYFTLVFLLCFAFLGLAFLRYSHDVTGYRKSLGNIVKTFDSKQNTFPFVFRSGSIHRKKDKSLLDKSVY